MASHQRAPNMCTVCSGPAFLKCIECDTIYCTSICQIRDWEKHQRDPSHIEMSKLNRQGFKPQNWKNDRFMVPKFNKVNAPSSVQNRLQAAVAKELPKKPQLDIEGTTNIIKRSLGLTERPEKPKASEEVSNNFAELTINSNPVAPEATQDVADGKVITSNKEDIPATIKPILSNLYNKTRELKADNDGYCAVTIETIDDVNHNYCVIMKKDKDEYNRYQVDLNNTYNDSEIKRISAVEMLESWPELLMINIENCWTRCKPVSIKVGKLLATTIDTGVAKVLDINKTEMKPVKQRESEIQPFGIKVKLVKVDKGDLEIGDVIEIRLIDRSEGLLTAEVRMDDTDSSSDDGKSKQRSEDDEPKRLNDVVEPKRHNIRDIKLQKIGPGKLKLLYIDGFKLSEGKLHACESTDESHDFYEKMETDIENYVKANPIKGSYKPVQHELLLVKFTDGLHYRAMCKKVSDKSSEVFFIDYGNETNANHEDIMPIPESLLFPCISRSFNMHLRSGRSIGDIDVKASVSKLDDNAEFTALIHDDLRNATVDEKIFIFKEK